MNLTLDQREVGRKASAAAHRARKIVCDRHDEEYKQVHGDLRVQMGLPRDPNEAWRKRTLQERITKLEDKLAQLRAQQQN